MIGAGGLLYRLYTERGSIAFGDTAPKVDSAS